MPINADKPHLWKQDIAASLDQFNGWFMKFAPKAYRDTRVRTTKDVERTLRITGDLASVTAEVLKEHPGILPTLRMSLCPPIARDRLVGLAHATKNLVYTMEEGKIPPRINPDELQAQLARIADIVARMLDEDIFPWVVARKQPTAKERHRAATIVADRLCGAVSDPIVRNAQEKRQLALVSSYLKGKGYLQKPHPGGKPITQMEPGTFCIHTNVTVGERLKVNIPIDIVVHPKRHRPGTMPILIEAKSAGDFTNVNKRRKEEATKMRQLRETYGEATQFVLFLCGYFDSGYLGYEAAEGIDWIWEHRIEDLDKLKL